MAGNTADMLLHLSFRNDTRAGLRAAAADVKALNAEIANTARPTAQQSASLKRLDRDLKTTYSNAAKHATAMSNLGSKWSWFVSLPIAAFFYKSAQAASSMAEQVNKAKVVFGAFYSDVAKQSRTAAKDLLQSSRQFTSSAGTFGALLAPSMSQKNNATTSVALVKLGGDLASFYESSTEDALAAIRSGLVGEVEPLRRYGITLSADQVNAEAKRAGTWDGKGTPSEQAKITARVAVITKQAALANGDVERTAGSAANQQKRLVAEFDNLKVSLGQGLLPVWNDLLHIGIAITSAFNGMPAPLRTAAIGFGLLAVAAGPVIRAWCSGATPGRLRSPTGGNGGDRGVEAQ